jgi:hypothetical protein
MKNTQLIVVRQSSADPQIGLNLSDSKRSKLFLNLKNRMQRRELAFTIVKSLGWSKRIREVGRPGGKHYGIMFVDVYSCPILSLNLCIQFMTF